MPLFQDQLFAQDDRVAIAVSGGADSVAALWLLRDLIARKRADVSLAGLIHVHHGLRGDEADLDEAFCRELARRAGCPIDVTHVDVRALAREARRSLEATGRDARYAAIAAAVPRLGATRVVTAHTLDDQAETVLLRLLRGSSMRGVSGIRPSRGIVVRPLLACRRAELRAYLAERGESFREDASNLDRAIPRNRIRHELLPVLESLTAGALPALARFAGLAADDEAFLAQAAIEAASAVVLSDSGGVLLRRDALNELPPALVRRVMRAAAERVAPGRTLAAARIEAMCRLARGEGGAHLDLPGLSADRRGAHVALTRPTATLELTFDLELTVPGSVSVAAAGVVVTADYAAAAPSELASGRGARAVVQASTVDLPFRVRNRRPGDRLHPLGAPGSRKLQDLLVDRKVPRAERDFVPVVVDATGRIVWVIGHAIAHECRVTAPESGVVVLNSRPVNLGETASSHVVSGA